MTDRIMSQEPRAKNCDYLTISSDIRIARASCLATPVSNKKEFCHG